MSDKSSFFEELKRRNVFRVVVGYVVLAWLVMQVADVVLNNISAPHWVFQALMFFLALGLLFSIFFSWAFEMTPEGLKRESEVDRSASITHVTGKKLDRMIIGILVLALGYFALDKFMFSAGREEAAVEEALEQVASVPAEQEAEADKSIAVLPFVNMSSDPEQEFFSDGLSEELLNLLAKIPELRVAARTSSFSLKGKEMQISEIGDLLNVAHVLEGSVRTSGDRVRITAQLIRSDNGYHLWSETYDRTMNDIFTIQDEIASQVVNALKLALLGQAPTATEVDARAHSLVLQARHFRQQQTRESILRAEDLFEEAIEIMPGYAEAWTGLANVYTEQALSGFRPPEEGFRLSLEAAEHALEANPDHAPAHAALGLVALYQNRIKATARYLQRALELEPANTNILNQAATLVELLGRMDEAIDIQRFVIERDPVNANGHAGLGRALRVISRYDEAIESYRTSLALSPNRYGSWQGIGEALLMKGEYEAAREAYSKEPDEEWKVKGTALANYALGNQKEFEVGFAELLERWGDEWPSEMAHVYAWIGDKDSAFEWLNRAVDQNEEGLYQQYFQPLLRTLHDDPRWGDFRERTIGRMETLAGVQFDVDLPE